MIAVNLWMGLTNSHVQSMQLLHLTVGLILVFDICRWNNARGLRCSWYSAARGVQRICFTGSKSTDKVIYSSGLTTPLLGYYGATDSPKCFSGAILNHPVCAHEGRTRMWLQVAATLAADLFTGGLKRTQCEEKNNPQSARIIFLVQSLDCKKQKSDL